MRCLDHLDYMPITCPTFGWGVKPPCNDPVTAAAVIAVGATAGSTVMQIRQAGNAAKQAEMNAEAQAQAINQEQKRQALEQTENQRRAAVEQKRFRSAQFAAMASSGAMTGTGTALDIEADTWAQQQLQLADQRYLADVQQRGLAAQASTVRQMGAAEASQIRGTRAGTALQGLASMAQIAMMYKAGAGKPGNAGGGTGGSSGGSGGSR
jgi:hypothetical protein